MAFDQMNQEQNNTNTKYDMLIRGSIHLKTFALMNNSSDYFICRITKLYCIAISTNRQCYTITVYIIIYTSVDTEMCCPKGKCGCQYFIWLTLKKKFMDTGVLDFFNKKLILDYYFCLKSGPVFLFQIFIIAPLPLPRDINLYH